jgi:hypothetical protein
MATNSLAHLSLQQLRRVVSIKEQIENLNKELGSVFGTPAPTVARATERPKRKMSAAAKARIAAAQKARWAKAKEGAPPKPANSPIRKMSAAARAKLAAAAKARWKKAKASGKSSLGG